MQQSRNKTKAWNEEEIAASSVTQTHILTNLHLWSISLWNLNSAYVFKDFIRLFPQYSSKDRVFTLKEP